MNWKASALPPEKGSPSILPSKSMVTRSPLDGAFVLGAQAEGAALLAQDLDRAVDGGLGHFGADALDFGGTQVTQLHLGVDLEGGVEGQRALGRLVLLSDLGHAGHAQLGFVDGVVEALAHAVVDHFVLHLVAVTLGHHAHRHLAGAEAVGLHGARKLLQARLDLAVDDLCRQREGDAAFELLEGFDLDGHDVSGMKGCGCRAGARGGTRTRTPVKASGPKPGASTNFATRAGGAGRRQTGDFSLPPAHPWRMTVRRPHASRGTTRRTSPAKPAK